MDELIPPEAKTRRFSTGKRCALVRDILVEHPERHTQKWWVGPEILPVGFSFPEGFLDDIVDTGSCGSAGCAVGWAIAAAPPSLVKDKVGIDLKGAAALGMGVRLTNVMAGATNKRERLIEFLDWASKVQPRDRTLQKAYKHFVTPITGIKDLDTLSGWDMEDDLMSWFIGKGGFA